MWGLACTNASRSAFGCDAAKLWTDVIRVMRCWARVVARASRTVASVIAGQKFARILSTQVLHRPRIVLSRARPAYFDVSDYDLIQLEASEVHAFMRGAGYRGTSLIRKCPPP